MAFVPLIKAEDFTIKAGPLDDYLSFDDYDSFDYKSEVPLVADKEVKDEIKDEDEYDVKVKLEDWDSESIVTDCTSVDYPQEASVKMEILRENGLVEPESKMSDCAGESDSDADDKLEECGLWRSIEDTESLVRVESQSSGRISHNTQSPRLKAPRAWDSAHEMWFRFKSESPTPARLLSPSPFSPAKRSSSELDDTNDESATPAKRPKIGPIVSEKLAGLCEDFSGLVEPMMNASIVVHTEEEIQDAIHQVLSFTTPGQNFCAARTAEDAVEFRMVELLRRVQGLTWYERCPELYDTVIYKAQKGCEAAFDMLVALHEMNKSSESGWILEFEEEEEMWKFMCAQSIEEPLTKQEKREVVLRMLDEWR